MPKFARFLHLFPALVFLALAVLFFSKIVLALAPANPLSWQLYLTVLAPLEGVNSLVPDMNPGLVAAGFLALAIGGLMLSPQGKWVRARFAYTHAAFFAILFNMVDSGSEAAGFIPIGNNKSLTVPDLTSLDPVNLALLAGIVFACASIHSRLVWLMRHPVRRVEPLAA